MICKCNLFTNEIDSLNSKVDLKQRLWTKMDLQLDDKIVSLKSTLSLISESKNTQTKSSAGDKYETSRAMMQMELDKIEWQLNNLTHLKTILNQIDPKCRKDKIELGTIVSTDRGNYFISIGLGKIFIDKNIVYTISKDSPMGKFLWSKETGYEGQFLNRSLKILNFS